LGARAGPEIFLRGQTGSRLDGSGMVGLGRRPEDAVAQAELAMANLRVLLEEAGGAVDEICKITVYISDRAYREAVYPVIGRHLAGIHPVSTGIIVPAFARPEILFEVDAVVVPKGTGPHERLRKYHSGAARYGREGQNLGCDFCMTVRAGGRLHLRGQTGSDLENRFHGLGDAAAQAEQAMANVRDLLAEAGAGMGDILKATLYVTDRAFLGPVLAVIARHLGGHRPALSALVIKGLASPDLLMEIDIVAADPRRG
jgi:enamine deaminase RidA (YjgF/YER057c/UK114 family)